MFRRHHGLCPAPVFGITFAREKVNDPAGLPLFPLRSALPFVLDQKPNVMKSQFLRSAAALMVVAFLVASCGPNDNQMARAANKRAGTVAPHATVAVHNGSAVISGRVPDQATKSALDSLVKNVKGIRSVTDNTTAVPGHEMSPSEADRVLQHDIDSTLHANGIDNVHIAISGGVITLTGSVKAKDLQTVLQMAGRAEPKKVINELTINR
jgi:hypothetical protein